MSKFEKFFASKKLMITSLDITLIAFAIMIVMNSIFVVSNLQYIFYVAFAVIMFFIALSMYRSFKKHETNAMNIVTGAAIGILLVFNIQICMSNIMAATTLFYIVTPIIEVILYAILMVNHVQINSIHKSTRGRILLNQVILIVIAAYQIFITVAFIVALISAPEMALIWIAGIAFALARVFISFMVICIESKLNAYKIDRGVAQAEGTWTDEKKAETKEKYFGK